MRLMGATTPRTPPPIAGHVHASQGFSYRLRSSSCNDASPPPPSPLSASLHTWAAGNHVGPRLVSTRLAKPAVNAFADVKCNAAGYAGYQPHALAKADSSLFSRSVKNHLPLRGTP